MSSFLDSNIPWFFADWPSKNSGQFGVQSVLGILAFQYWRLGDGLDKQGLIASATSRIGKAIFRYLQCSTTRCATSGCLLVMAQVEKENVSSQASHFRAINC